MGGKKMRWKYIYDVLRQQSALAKYCGEKGNLVADECDLAIKVIKKASMRGTKKDNSSMSTKCKEAEYAFCKKHIKAFVNDMIEDE